MPPPHAIAVAPGFWQIRLAISGQPQPLCLRDSLEGRNRLLEHCERIMRLTLDRHASGLDACGIDEVVDEPQHGLRCAPYSRNGLRKSMSPLNNRRLPSKTINGQEDHRRWILQIVGNDGQDLFTHAHGVLRLLVQLCWADLAIDTATVDTFEFYKVVV